MNYPSIRIEGSIFSPDIVDRLDEAVGQRPADFGLDSSIKVKDEIARAWADAQDYWRIFQRKLETIKPGAPSFVETRNHWLEPLMGLLGYNLEREPRAGIQLNEKSYLISHRVANRANIPLHIVGYNDQSGLDRKPEAQSRRMSAHAMLQEYLNLSEQLYGIVTNGHVLRLLRDSSRLIKLTYLEFDLDRIFADGLFADFAILYRLLHASRLPVHLDAISESLLERYHQDSLDSGTRIRDGLSKAVESAIASFANGFLSHPENQPLQDAIANGTLNAGAYYQYLLRLIYRLLFLMVIEERGLVFPQSATASQRSIYLSYYSVQRLRRLSERRYLADKRKHDLWLSLCATFRLFEAEGPGQKLGISPLAGDLFGPRGIGPISQSTLNNDCLLGCLRALSLYENPISGQTIRVNYGALNVEEFGSVYEGLLEFQPVFRLVDNRFEFGFVQGDERAATGSHYTPDDLVQPLIKHSLDYLIADKLKESNPKQALLDLRVADISCGSGHILLAAARRIATELAILETGEDQPAPPAFRSAIREVIRHCIYGVDLNPLAVELCKVALWLEAHNPGEPLNFLDHHIKCGNAIVGFVHPEEVEKGVPDEAFIRLAGDDKDVAAVFRKANKNQKIAHESGQTTLTPTVQRQLAGMRAKWNGLSALPERNPVEIELKKTKFIEFSQSREAFVLHQVASIPIAQFYIPKTEENRLKLSTDADFRRYWNEGQSPQGQATAAAWTIADNKRFFHWFLEFPEIIQRGGFDCILGNPPYLGDKQVSGTYGHPFCHYVKWEYAPTGLSDLVVYFVRRIYNLIRPNGFTAFITTNSITDGDIRRDGLEQVLAQGGAINMAVRGIRWPGRANLVVSLVALHKGDWRGKRALDGREVLVINAYFEDSETVGEPQVLLDCGDMVFTGYHFWGDGFVLTHTEAATLTRTNSRNAEVIFPLINGDEINNVPDQKPGRSIINFSDWTIDKARTYVEPFEIVERLVRPFRQEKNRERTRLYWWQYAEVRPGMRRALKKRELSKCFVSARTTKHLCFSMSSTRYVFSDALNVLTTNRWDLFAVVQSTVHEVWARKYSGALKQDLRYSPSKCFDTFPFPAGQWEAANPELAELGERYHEHRRALMLQLWLGLTDIYNLFHTKGLTPERVAKVSKKSLDEAIVGYKGILELRRLHVELDTVVRDAYGWNTALDHDFYEIETLPENDRVRYMISPAARKELLQKLLAENHRRSAADAASVSVTSKVKPAKVQPMVVRETVRGYSTQSDPNLFEVEE